IFAPEPLIARIKKIEDNITEVQLFLAKIKGNFKRGNEKFGENTRKLTKPLLCNLQTMLDGLTIERHFLNKT
ncbi:hypothetical protein CN957_32915, partial [Bacillus cereus]